MKKKLFSIAFFVLAMVMLAATFGCDDAPPTPAQESNSGVKATAVQVKTGTDGLTAEQRNVRDRLVEDNKPGAIKHLYIISPYSGQVILYSTVKGKVTSGGKRLTPTVVAATDGQYVDGEHRGVSINVGGRNYFTGEVLQDDGTYGSSGDYLYWWDVQGRYHQHYLTGGQIVHISSEPLPVKSVTINLESRPVEQ